MTLAGLLAPHTVPAFLVDCFGRRPLHFPGDPGRFAELLPPSGSPGNDPLSRLARDLEKTLEAPVHPEWDSASPESGPERLPSDRFVLQLAGESRCSLWDRDLPEPHGDACEIALQAGGAAYFPRGWWLAERSPAPGTRVLFSIRNPTGRDLLEWLFEHLKEHEYFAADVPRFAGPAAQADYIDAFRRVIGGACRAPGALALFSRSRNHRAPLAPTLGSPWTPGLPADRLIDFLPARRLHFQRADAESFRWTCNGKTLRFPLDAAPLLQFLEERAPVAAEAFYDAFHGEFGRAELEDFLSVLAAEGFIASLDPQSA